MPSMFYTVLAFVVALFFGVVGVLLLVRARRVARTRRLTLTAGILTCVYAVWAATMQVLSEMYPVVAAVPGADIPEPTPLRTFYNQVLAPVWGFANILLVCAVAVLLIIALARSRAPVATPVAAPPGPPGPWQYGPPPQQPPPRRPGPPPPPAGSGNH